MCHRAQYFVRSGPLASPINSVNHLVYEGICFVHLGIRPESSHMVLAEGFLKYGGDFVLNLALSSG